MQSVTETRPSWSLTFRSLDWEKIIFCLLLVLAVLTRFYKLEPRVMSHDENSHTYYSWLLYQGEGYQHDPITHGPFQFHVVALSYFLFGATDTTARLPAVLFSIATIAFMWCYRRYFGKAGALVAAVLFLISPYMLYYGRYVRNESFVAFFGVMTIWATLAYLDTGKFRYMLWLTAAIVLHFTSKETAYIYTAQLLLFLGIYFLYRVTSLRWLVREYRTYFLLALMGTVLIAGVAMLPIYQALKERRTVGGNQGSVSPTLIWAILILLILAVAVLALAAYFLVKGFHLERIRQERSFDLLVVVGTLILPLLAAFPLKLIGWTVPTNASSVNLMTSSSILRMGLVVVLMMIISIIVGLWWNRRWWLVNAGLFYGIFTFFYTTYFTNTDGFFTGLLGSLGYWMAQQAVQRGTQPWYYYIFLQVPIYEYLPALGTLLGIGLVLWQRRKRSVSEITPAQTEETLTLAPDDFPPGIEQPLEKVPTPTPDDLPTVIEQPLEKKESAPTVTLLIFWTLSGLAAYSYAGEKMPWLTVHVTLPMILFTAWTIGHLIDTTDWRSFRSQKGPQIVLLLAIFILSLVTCFGLLLSTTPPLHGNSLAALQATGAFVVALAVALVSIWAIGRLLRGWQAAQVGRLATFIVFGLLAFLTARTAFIASYINYDRPLEYLVYAHCGTGVKEALAQIEDLSRRTTDGLYLKVAYDNETSYPYWWYLRDYPNALGFGSNPTFELRDYPVILVGDANYSKIEPVVKDDYFFFDYIRIWWPNEDYKRLTWTSIKNELKADWAAHPETYKPKREVNLLDYFGQAWKKHIGPFFTNANVREAIWQIWFNRDYTSYAELQGRTEFTLPTWSPAGRMRLYIRKDVASQLWDYGISAQAAAVKPDPYAGKQETLQAKTVIGSLGDGEGQFQLPRGIAMAPDGTIYVADTYNYRIQHFNPDGTFIQQWGSKSPDCPYPSAATPNNVPSGTFCEPWGIAVGKDGSVYVADTWNNRIQKFTADGQFLTMWGHGVAQDSNDLLGFYGPRGIVVDSLGNVLVTDTGNSRVVVFNGDGKPITQFGSTGVSSGQFAEPVGMAVDASGQLYVVDTWNQRIQVFTSDGVGGYVSTTSYEVSGWETTSVNNKPFITIDPNGNIFITDPDGYRVIELSNNGTIVRYWGNIGSDTSSFSLPTGIVADTQGGVWVVDSNNHRLMYFTLPK